MKYQDQAINAENLNYDVDDANLSPTLSYDNLMPSIRHDTSSRALKALAAEQEYNLSVERNRAVLTYNALNLTAQLSAVEVALSENCPAAQSRLRAIVDSFAYAQATKIVRY